MVIKPELSGGGQGSVVQLFKQSDQRGFDVFAASVFRELRVQWPTEILKLPSSKYRSGFPVMVNCGLNGV